MQEKCWLWKEDGRLVVWLLENVANWLLSLYAWMLLDRSFHLSLSFPVSVWKLNSWMVHPSGWMQMDIFGQWFYHFLTTSGASKLNPVLLILDGHSTHVRNLSVINKARDRGVVIVCLPPHCSHKIQPLDVSFMKPLSTYYNTEVTKWLRSHPGRTVSVFQIAQLLTPAFQKAATAQTAANGFRKTGLWPVNRDIFEDHEFAPSEITNRQLSESPAISSSEPSQEPLESTPAQAVPGPQLIEQPLPEPSFSSSSAA